MTTTSTHVVIGVIVSNGKILLAKRPTTTHQGGLWEFPGGKIKDNEKPFDAIIREVNEEVGLIVRNARPLIRYHYNYRQQSLFINVWCVYDWEGQAHGRENQVIKWVSISDLDKITMPAANEIILNAMRLPSLYLICPTLTGNVDDYLENIDACLKAGVRLLQLRCGDDVIIKNKAFICQVLDLCNSYESKLLLNSKPELVASYNVHGVHLSSSRMLQLNERPLDNTYYVAASCHNKKELIHASKIKVDFVVLSPVENTKSHPEAESLGWEKFSELAEDIKIPIFALGGMHPKHIKIAWRHGAQGVAIQSSIWSADNPASVIKECVENIMD